MKALKSLVLALAVAGICSTAAAQAFTEDFDSYAAGTNLQNVGGWKGWDGAAGASAPVSNAFAYSGSNSVEIIASADLVHEFDVAGGKWIFSTMMYVPSGSTGTSYFILLNSYDDGANQDWSAQIVIDMTAGTLSSYYVAGSGATIVYDEWVELKLVIDLDEDTVDEYYNGALLATHEWDDDDHGTIGAIDLYGNSASSVYYDDIMLESYNAWSSDPGPADTEPDAARDVVLSWTPGIYAATHDVYFGTDYDAVSSASRDNPMDVLVSEGQAATTLDLEGLLEFGQTYYWRVDDISAAPESTMYHGTIWTFTAEPLMYAVENITITTNTTPEEGAVPENTVNGSGLNEDGQHSRDDSTMWLGVPTGDDPVYIQFEFDRVYKLYEMPVWNYNGEFEMLLAFGIKDVTVEYSTDGADWMVLGDVTLAQGTAQDDYVANTTLDFAGVAAKFVCLTVNSGYGMFGKYGLSEVRFLYLPAHARKPQPVDEAVGVGVNTVLSWRPGREAAAHDVYFGTAPEALTLADTTTTDSYGPGAMDLATTYYWKVNEAEAISTWEGDLWTFTTEEFLVVDNFESYDDEENRIYDTWSDGWVNDTGATVGNIQGPFAEQTIVNSGRQSMPLFYDNVDFTTAEADLPVGQNWTASGIQSLSLSFHGAVDNSGQLYVKIDNTKIAYDGPAANIARPAWQLWNIDLATTGASLSNVSKLTIGIEGAGAQGVVYIDDIRLYPEIAAAILTDVTTPSDTVKGVPDDSDWPAAESPDLAIDDSTATKYLHRKGGSMATGLQIAPVVGSTVVTGLALTTANDVPTRDPITFELSGSNASIDGPYELIAAGEVADFTGEADWPRFTRNETPIEFENTVAYAYYQIVFPTLRGESETLMQIAEVELLGELAP
jgi:F5/8 type C domain